MKRRLAGLAVAVVVGTVTGPVAAGDNDLVVSRLGERTDSGVVPSAQSFRSLASELGVVLAPRLVSPTDTLGFGGFQFSADVAFTTISSDQPYWRVLESSSAPDNPTPGVEHGDGTMVRIPAGTRTPEVFVASLNELTGGPTAGLVPSNDNTAFVRVLDTENFPITEASRGIELFATPAWETWVVDLDDPTSATKLERAPLAGGIKWFEVDGEVYENESQADFSSTTLVRTTGTDTLTPALTVPGAPFNILRLR